MFETHFLLCRLYVSCINIINENTFFQRPRQKFLEGQVNATDNPQPCIQPHPGTNNVIGSEDCLALNVFTPELPTGTEGKLYIAFDKMIKM